MLTVDDFHGVDLTVIDLDLVEDDRAEKVAADLVGARASGVALKHGLGAPGDVLPERLPLLFLLPDVGALEERHDVAALPLEEVE